MKFMTQLEDILRESMIGKIDKHYIFSLVYVLVSLILGFYLNNGLIIFLGWNMILATFAYFLSRFSMYLKLKSASKILLFISSLLWLLFLPNTFYLLTDLIHFQNYEFFREYPNSYHEDLSNWLVFLHLTIGAFYGAKLGVTSVLNMESNYAIKTKYRVLVLFIIFLLSSIGIYIGRFIRLNSWDLFKIPSALLEIFSKFHFFIGFITIFTILHFFCYILFKRTNH